MDGNRTTSLTGTLLTALLAVCAPMSIPAVSPALAPRALPPPPYARFAGQSFEPSAAAFDPATNRVLVLSDHDTTLYRYELGAAGLVLPRGERHEQLLVVIGEVAIRYPGHHQDADGAIADLEWRGKDRVFDPKKIKAVIDHVTPAKDSKSALQAKIMRDWAARL